MATPELRFKGFEGEWSEKQLEEVANRVTKKNTDNAISETFTNSAVQGIVSQLDFFTHSVSNQANISGYYVVSPEDFVYNPRISQKAPYGPINRNKNDRTGVISPLYSVFSINGLNHRFSEWFFKSSRWHDFMRQNGDSGARHDRFSIGSDEFFKMPINIPNASEQKEIGVYLESLENSCVASASAVQKIKLLKQSMLVKMFPQDGASVPEVRFESFTGNWEQTSIEYLADTLTGFPFPSEKFEASGIRLIRGINVKRGYVDDSDANSEFWESSKGIERYLLEENDILLQMDGALIGKSMAKIQKKHLPALLVQRVTRLRSNKDIDQEFLYQAFRLRFLEYIRESKTETAVPHLSLTDIREYPVSIPSYEEQAAIGSYFRQLDQLIELEEAKLAKLTQLKTAFLSKMFV